MADHEMARGTSHTITVAVVDGDGDPLDLTGRTLRFTAKRSVRDAQADAVIAKTTDAGITHQPQSGETVGLADIDLAPLDTSGLAPYPLALAYDVELVDGADVFVTETGSLLVTPEVTTA